MDGRYTNSIRIGMIISAVMIIINIGESLLSVRLNLVPGTTLLDYAGVCLLVWIIAIVICTGIGYLAARLSRALIHTRHDAVSIAFVAGGTVGFINGANHYLIQPIVLAVAGHLISPSVLSLPFSLLFGSVLTVVGSIIIAVMASIGGRLYFSYNIKRNRS